MSEVATAQLDAAQEAVLAPATTYYLSLHTGEPGTTGANEGSEGRQAITFSPSTGGTQVSVDGQTWASASGGTYDHFGLWTATDGGAYLRGGVLDAPISPPNGAQIAFTIGAVTFTAS